MNTRRLFAIAAPLCLLPAALPAQDAFARDLQPLLDRKSVV